MGFTVPLILLLRNVKKTEKVMGPKKPPKSKKKPKPKKNGGK